MAPGGSQRRRGTALWAASQPNAAGKRFKRPGGSGSAGSSPNGTQQGHDRPKTRARTSGAARAAHLERQIDSPANTPANSPAQQQQEPATPGSAAVPLPEGLQDRLQRLEAAVAGLTQQRAAAAGAPNAPGGDAPSDMEARMAALEARVQHLDSLLRTAAGQLKGLSVAEGKKTDALSKKVDELMEGMKRLDWMLASSLERADALEAELRHSVAKLKAELAAGLPRAAPGGSAAGGTDPPAGARAGDMGRTQPGQTGQTALLANKLLEESSQHGRTLKLVGFLDPKQGVRGLELCERAGEALSRLLGGPTVQVDRAHWLRVRAGASHKLLVVLRTNAMAQAVRGLRGRPGGPGAKLGPGQRILDEFGPVEMAVREVLFQEKGQLQGSWVSRSALMVKGSDGRFQARPLSAKALAAGLTAMHEGPRAQRAGPAPSPARPARPVERLRRRHAGRPGACRGGHRRRLAAR